MPNCSTCINITSLQRAFGVGVGKEALTHGNKSTLGETKFLYQRRPVFVSFPVTKPVVTQGTTTRHQMKDMDIIFPLIPLSYLWVEGSGWILQPFKVEFFSKFSKMLETDYFC